MRDCFRLAYLINNNIRLDEVATTGLQISEAQLPFEIITMLIWCPQPLDEQKPATTTTMVNASLFYCCGCCVNALLFSCLKWKFAKPWQHD